MKFLYSVHPSVLMAQRWAATLPERTGRSMEQWIALVKKSGPRAEKERREWLKTKHNLGTNAAGWIAERAAGKGQENCDPAAYLEAAEKYVAQMFSGSNAALQPIYDALLQLGLKQGKDVKACPCRTMVPLYRNHVFAQIKPTTRTRIDFGFALQDTKPTGRLIDTGGYAKKDRITHRIPITSIADIDDEVKRWLKAAYELAIPGNRPVYQRLRELLDARQAIAFAGAGVSAPLYPLWPELLKSLAHAPVERGLATAADEEYWLRTAEKRPLHVASQIHQKLTDAHYYPFLYETFKDRPPYFTPAHDALTRCNFKAWITTNYDQGLVEARRVRRPEIRDTSYAIWNQPAEIERWLSGDRFGPDSAPILFAHGHFADAPNIVLDHESYRRSYGTPVYRRFYEDLWIKEHLVFAGFSFNDVTLSAIADEIVGKFVHSGPPRHIAILALNEDYNDGMRREYLETFHADVLFYPESLETIMPVITAIELLLECGDLKAAADLYWWRLENGNIFKWIAAPHWGMEVARWFVRDEERRQRLEAQLGARWLGAYLNAVGLYADIAGESETALPHYAAAEAIDRRADDGQSLLIGLQNLAEVEASLGRLGDAVRHATEALELAVEAKNDRQTRNSHTNLAFAASLRGEIAAAAKSFAEANAIENRIDLDGDDLYSLRGIKWAEHLVRTGQTGRARKLTIRNREICEARPWQQTVAECDWMLGWLDAVGGDWRSAHAHLDQAEATFTRGHMIQELARVHLTRAACRFGEGYLDRSLTACERALDLAAPRNYRLIHADGLVLRARIALTGKDATSARNDCESALQIAGDCEYAWAERDACEVLAEAWATLGNHDEAARYAGRAANLNRRLTPAAG